MSKFDLPITQSFACEQVEGMKLMSCHPLYSFMGFRVHGHWQPGWKITAGFVGGFLHSTMLPTQVVEVRATLIRPSAPVLVAIATSAFAPGGALYHPDMEEPPPGSCISEDLREVEPNLVQGSTVRASPRGTSPSG